MVKDAINNQNWATQKLSDIAKPTITVDPDTPFRGAAKLMLKYGVGSLIVKRQGIVRKEIQQKLTQELQYPQFP